MCDTCGCGISSIRTIDFDERLLASNVSVAEHNRTHLAERKIFAINLMGTPGAGKTALLEAMIARWRSSRRIAVIEGDQATDRDSARIRVAGATACQVETGLGCHLDAHQIHDAMHHLNLGDGDLLFIENVGNLVCPALFDLGERLRVVVTSPTEGVDKPLKYPPMFRAAHVVVLNKSDLVPHVPFNLDEWTEYVRAINSHARIIKTSALSGEGIGDLLAEIGNLQRSFSASISA
ncbi:MAG TPA: hydrogenase nickel incorporation protein HypB [Candidatus Binataceae bacterium]|nr:hydrogenase nickel incorporation protein HypB [Candidatus Binataceae bacterium]